MLVMTLLYIYCKGSTTLYLLVYIDDIVIIGIDSQSLESIISKLQMPFTMKSLGSAYYFLDIKAYFDAGSLYLSQSKYVVDISQWASMLDAKPADTPIAPKVALSLHDGDPLADVTNYQSIVGPLQNVTITQTDISFVVNRVCQLMNLNTAHWQIVKRILQYLQGLISQGLKTASPLLDLTAYSDVGWTSDSHDQWSTIGVCVYFGLNLLS